MGMNRRRFLKIGGASLASAGSIRQALANEDNIIQGGWVDIPIARQNFIARSTLPLASQHSSELKGDSDDKVIKLWKLWERANGGEFYPHYQEIGDCVSQGGGLGVETLSSVQVAQGANEKWSGKISTEVLYGGSRVEVGGGNLRGDGSTGAWLAEFLEDYGSVARGKYGDIDLTKYDPDLAKAWGKRRSEGIPLPMEELSREHPVKRAILVDGGWEQACDLMANGYPIVVCSSVGFNSKTDRDGFLRGDRTWYHCMLLWGCDRKSRREGGCLANSWGPDWLHGPEHEEGTPDGCFWAEARTINKMLNQGDSYALTEFQGFKRRNLDYLLW